MNTLALRVLFLLALATMLALTAWAGAHVPLWGVPRSVTLHPWFLATLGDAYWGFLTFYAWVWYKEPAALPRALWLVAILTLGNIAMASYALAVLLRLPPGAGAGEILLRGRPVTAWLPAGLVGGLLGACAIAAAL